MTVGQRIKQKRIELGLTQEELAERMGYSGKSSVCAAETSGDNITTTKVQKFADALGVTQKYLMYGEEDTDHQVVDQIIERRAPSVQDRVLLELYHNVSPEIRSMVDYLLKSAQQDGEVPHLPDDNNK